MEELTVRAKELAIAFGPKVLAALAILLIGRIIAGIIRSLITKGMRHAKIDETLVKFTASVSYVALMAFVVISAMGALDIPTGSFVAILGAAGLAVGLALQGSLANFASGVLMIIFKPFKVGDFVEAGGVAGIIEEIGIFNTELKTGDNKKVIVPNSSVTGGNITNYSANETRRIDLVVGVGYGDDLDKVKTTLQDILAGESRILPEPEPTIGVAELADSSVNLVVRPWVNTADYWPVKFALTEEIKKRFDKEGISIPFPQQDVHMHQVG
ncbi:mechanosensitive ion channel [Kiritimatiellaeota bacterium B1221]|nr:mechanosensitive ion channel [Kiritimatiellaeota bacterium B1221]